MRQHLSLLCDILPYEPLLQVSSSPIPRMRNALSPLKLLLRELSTLLTWAWNLWSSAVKRTVLINVILNSIRFHGKDLMQEREHSKRTARYIYLTYYTLGVHTVI